MLIGRWVQQRTYDALRFDRDFTSYFPVAVTRLTPEGDKSISVRELRVGSERQPHNCVLEEGFPVSLSPAQAQLAARWLVGCFDLTQAGNAGEPLHATLNVPQQLLLWTHATGKFTASPVAEVPTASESAALGRFPRTREWRDSRVHGVCSAAQPTL